MSQNFWSRLFTSLFARARRRKTGPSLRPRLTPAYRPRMEALEDRVVPATITYTQATGLLQFTADPGKSDNVTITAPAANMVQIEVGNGDSITLAGDAATSADFSQSTSVTALDTLIINTAPGHAPLVNFDIALGDQDDTLAFGLASAPNGVTNVSIDGGAGTDNVTLNPTTLLGNLSVTAETTHLDGNLQTDGGDITLTGNTVVAASSVTLDTKMGTTGNAGAIRFSGGTVSSTLAEVNDLTLDTSTGAGFSGGAIDLVAFDNTAGAFLNDVSIDARGGTAGVISLASNLVTQEGPANPSSITIAGDLRLGASVQLNTNGGPLGDGGPINLSNATVSATVAAANLSLTANAGSQLAANGGAVTLGVFGSTGGDPRQQPVDHDDAERAAWRFGGRRGFDGSARPRRHPRREVGGDHAGQRDRADGHRRHDARQRQCGRHARQLR